MNKTEKYERLQGMLAQVSGDGGIESLAMNAPLAPAAFESVGVDVERGQAQVHTVMEKLGQGAELSPAEIFGLEAIILPAKRPVVLIQNNRYLPIPLPDWEHLNGQEFHERLEGSFTSIGRIEVPLLQDVPYGGTGFVVGPNLLMTNRHVAELFTQGLGVQLRYEAGGSAIDFKREAGTPPRDFSARVIVKKVLLLHPYWDMALLQVEGLPASAKPLRLSTRNPEEFFENDVVVVGYPARDTRNDLALQDTIFDSQYGVKRLQPGKVRNRESVRSFETTVNALTHDSSTLGGNSGSAVIDVHNGEVIGLHFAGVYLKANYAVSTYDLARDARLVDFGLTFQGKVPPTRDYDAAWRRAGGGPKRTTDENSPVPPPVAIQPGTLVATPPNSVASFTIPLHISVSIGAVQVTGGMTPGLTYAVPATTPLVASPPAAEIEKVPVIYPNLSTRGGYRAKFLKFADGSGVDLPTLTPDGESAVVRLDNGSHILKYHKFSVVLHKQRRLALFTAANVDWRPSSREINGAKPSRKKLNGFAGDEREDWATDPRIPLDYQLPDYFYVKDQGAFDRGHLVRRDDVAWGESFEDMQKGNGDTFHTTNCSPQTAEFNQSKYGEFNWGELENMVQQQTKAEKVCVFAGPVLDPDDRFFHGLIKNGQEVSIQIPRRFWKIIVSKADGDPQVFGFVLDQDLAGVNLHAEMAVPQAWKRYLRPITTIEKHLQGLVDLAWFKTWDQYNI